MKLRKIIVPEVFYISFTKACREPTIQIRLVLDKNCSEIYLKMNDLIFYVQLAFSNSNLYYPNISNIRMNSKSPSNFLKELS